MTRRSDLNPPHTPHPVTRSAFARRAGRKPSSVTEACQGPLLAACLPGGRIDAAHGAAVAWATKRGIDPAALLDQVARLAAPEPDPEVFEVPGATDARSSSPGAAARRGKGRPKAGAGPATSSDDDYSQPANAGDLLNCTLLELTTKHGSAQGFSDWLETRKQIAEVARLESRNDRDARRLISSELVRMYVFDLVETQNRKLLTVVPQTLAVRAVSAVRANKPLEEVKAMITSAIGTELRVSKEKVRRAIRACKAGDNPVEVSASSVEEHRSAEEIKAFARQLIERLQAEAVPTLVDFLLKEIGRAAAGSTWNATAFAEVMATRADLGPKAERTIGKMLDAHINNAVTEVFTQEQST